MKNQKIFLLLICFFSVVPNSFSQIAQMDMAGFYLSADRSEFAVISYSNDSLFFQSQLKSGNYLNCSATIQQKKILVRDSLSNRVLQLEISNDKNRISDMNVALKRVSLAEPVLNSDSLFSFVGYTYINCSENSRNEFVETNLVRCSIPYLKKFMTQQDTLASPYANLCTAYYRLGLLDSAVFYWREGRKMTRGFFLWPRYSSALSVRYMNLGLASGQKGEIKQAILFLEKAKEIDSLNAEIRYNLGGAYFTEGKMKEAKIEWESTLKLDPDNDQARNGLLAIPEEKKKNPGKKKK